MDLRRLGLFLAVVDHGGFTAAANAIHVAQPSISLAVRELERELGAELIVRSRRGATLTPAGEALVGPARQAQRDVATAAAAVSAVTGLTAGHLDIASLPTLAADPLAPMVGRFRQEYPAVTVHLAAPADSAAIAESVRSGDTEIGITEAGRGNRRTRRDLPLRPGSRRRLPTRHQEQRPALDSTPRGHTARPHRARHLDPNTRRDRLRTRRDRTQHRRRNRATRRAHPPRPRRSGDHLPPRRRRRDRSLPRRRHPTNTTSAATHRRARPPTRQHLPRRHPIHPARTLTGSRRTATPR